MASFSFQMSFGAEAFRDPAECVINVRDTPIVDLYPFLVEVKVDASRAQAAVATLTFESRRDEHGQWTVQDQGVLVPWEPISIQVAFGTRVEEIMRGYIREVRATYPDNAAGAKVVVECQDESIALDRGHVRKAWGSDQPTTDADILQEIVAGKHNLSLDPDSAPGMSGLTLNQDGTDIQFLRSRAEANGYELLFQSGSVYFGPMRLDAEPLPPILVYAGPDTSCVQMSVKTDGHQPTKVAVDVAKSADASSERVAVGPNLTLLGTQSADADGAGLDDFTWLLSRQGSADEAELNARAQAKANEFAMRVHAEGEVDGTIYGHVLPVGMPVPVDGIGAFFGGVYYVDSVTHSFTLDGYKQSVKLIRNAYGDNNDGGGSSALSGIL